MKVAVDATGTSTVTAFFNTDTEAGDYLPITLVGGDKLLAKAGDQSQQMTVSPVSLPGIPMVTYAATFSGASAAGTVYSIDFERTGGRKSAPNSNVTLPPTPEITTPSPMASFSRASDDITVTFTPASQPGDVDVYLVGPCIQSGGGDAQLDAGVFVFPRGTLIGMGTCTATLNVASFAVGQIDPAFWSAPSFGCMGISASVLQTLTLESTP